MPTFIENFFTEADRADIVEATRDAEQRTAGELVCYIVERCDDYSVAAWRLGMAGGVLCALATAFWRERYGGWGAPDHVWVVAALGIGALLGWLLSRWDVVARAVVEDATLIRRAEARAAEAFVEEQVFATRERTGVLLFLALFEHRVVAIADEGIHARVSEDAWDQITDRVAAGIRAGKPADALIAGVNDCASLLESHGVTPDPAQDPANELSNEPRFRKR